MYPRITATIGLFAASAFSLPTLQKRDLSIADIAGGDVPNGGPPASISDTAVAFFQGVNFLENLESTFFAHGLRNLTEAWNHNNAFNEVIEVVRKVQAQEVIHTQTATTILKHFNKQTFEPCEYVFPVENAKEFLSLANTITSVGIGAVINGAATLAMSDPGLVQGPASIIGTEARHDAFFRLAALGVVPNPAPFDTRISAPFALNLASEFIVLGSCKTGMPSFPVIPPLKAEVGKDVLVTGTGKDIEFSFEAAKVEVKEGEALWIGWVNQNNKFVFTEAKVVGDGKVKTTIPEKLSSVAFAALTKSKEAADVNALTKITIAGPAPVQIS
ncbi:MAG: hypothetical protein LQ342_000271 [Letrouitia transgressa]|nr:MAG: hypothetical protein LQ342_000271 [Letrouitia transgressa]